MYVCVCVCTRALQTSALEFVTEHYPHMLPHYNAVSKYVLKSDILRVMILDKLGEPCAVHSSLPKHAYRIGCIAAI